MLNLIFYLFFIFCSNAYAEPDCFVQTCVSCEQCDEKVCKDKCGNFSNKTFFSMRPQDSNSARRILNQIDKLNAPLDIVDFSITYEYQSTFNRNNRNLINWFLFDNKSCLTVGTPGDNQTFDINAQQLGLATSKKPELVSEICFNPRVRNFITDIQFRFNFDRFACGGLWVRIGLPIAQNETDLNICVIQDNTNNLNQFPSGLMATDCQKVKSPFTSICQAIQGDPGFGDIPTLKCGKFSGQTHQVAGLAGLNFELGYDFVRDECRYIGLGVYAVAPTGTRPNDKFIFDPVIGSNRSWQLGLEFYSGNELITACNGINVSFYTDFILTHLFKAKQTRLFALKNNGPLSQFLLLKQFNAIGSSIVGAERVGNILCGTTKIGADLMFDGSIMFQINKCNFFANIGYNLWARTKEKRSKTVCLRNFAQNTFGIKGNLPLSQIIHFEESGCGETGFDECVSNLSTASQSLICNIAPADQTTTFIQISDIDFNAPLHPDAISHKIFGSLGYNTVDCALPIFFEISGEAEFSRNNAALEQWGVLFTFGMLI